MAPIAATDSVRITIDGTTSCPAAMPVKTSSPIAGTMCAGKF